MLREDGEQLRTMAGFEARVISVQLADEREEKSTVFLFDFCMCP